VEQVLSVEIDANIDGAQESSQELLEVMKKVVSQWMETGRRRVVREVAGSAGC
jgi:DNA-binding transcriptional regulator YdaS (Cro superfamily)